MLIKLVERHRAMGVGLAEEQDDIRLFDPEHLGFAPVLVNVEIIGGDPAVAAGPGIVIGRGDVDVFAQQILHVVVGVNRIGVVNPASA